MLSLPLALCPKRRTEKRKRTHSCNGPTHFSECHLTSPECHFSQCHLTLYDSMVLNVISCCLLAQLFLLLTQLFIIVCCLTGVVVVVCCLYTYCYLLLTQLLFCSVQTTPKHTPEENTMGQRTLVSVTSHCMTVRY